MSKLITWEWERVAVIESKTMVITLFFNSRRGRRPFYRLSHTEGDDYWHIMWPREFLTDVGVEVDLKPVMGCIRDRIAELLAEEFAGVG